jgi:hypothetical protein
MHLFSLKNVVEATIQKDFNIEKFENLYNDKKISNSLFLLILEIYNYFNFSLIKKYVLNKENKSQNIQFAWLSDSNNIIDIYMFSTIYTLNLKHNIKKLNDKDITDMYNI